MLQPSRKHTDAPPKDAAVTRRAWLMLALATTGFAVNFWAWPLLSPLGPRLKDSLALTSFQQSLLVAVPVVVGSLGRIPVGALADRFGGRVMFPLVSAATIVPVLYLGLAGQDSLAALVAGGFSPVAQLAPANKVGSVTGVVGAAGGLGGFVPPLLMGSVYGAYGFYAAA